MNTSRLDKTNEHDALLVEIVKPMRILSALAWPADAEKKFLEAWRAGKPELPVIYIEQQDYSDQIEALEAM